MKRVRKAIRRQLAQRQAMLLVGTGLEIEDRHTQLPRTTTFQPRDRWRAELPLVARAFRSQAL